MDAVMDRTQWAHLLPEPTEQVFSTKVIASRDAGPEQEVATRGPDAASAGGPIYQREGGAFYSVWNRDDSEGNSFTVACTGLVENNNITWAEVYYTPKGAPFPQQLSFRIDPVWKIDDMHVKVSRREDNPARADLVFLFGSHSIGLPNRYIVLEMFVMEDVYAFDPLHEFLSEGGVGGFRGGNVIPNPEPGPGMTEEEMEEVLRRVLGLGDNGTLLGNFGAGGNVRVALEQKVLDGMRDGHNASLPTNDPNGIGGRAAEFRHFQRLQFAEDMLWLLDPNNGHPAAGGVRYLLRYRTVEDGAYTAGMNAIRDSGLTKPAAGTRAMSVDLDKSEEVEAKEAAEAALAAMRERWAAEAEEARIAAEKRAQEKDEEDEQK